MRCLWLICWSLNVSQQQWKRRRQCMLFVGQTWAFDNYLFLPWYSDFRRIERNDERRSWLWMRPFEIRTIFTCILTTHRRIQGNCVYLEWCQKSQRLMNKPTPRAQSHSLCIAYADGWWTIFIIFKRHINQNIRSIMKV